MEAWAAASEETTALQEISAVASSVTKDLESVIQRCDAFDSSTGDILALREISSATQKVREDLVQNDEERLLAPQSSAMSSAEKAYDDPVLAKARKIAAFTNRLCEDMNSTSRTFGVAARDSIEVESLREISAVTRQVCESMRALQGESWAEGVLRLAQGGMELGADEHLPMGLAGEPRDAVEVDPEDPDVELTPHNGAGAPVPAGLTAQLSTVEGLPDLEELLAQNDASEGFSDKDINRMQTAFKRFKIPDSSDLHVGDVCSLLRYLGHVMTQEEGVMPIIKEVTSYDYLDFDEFVSFMERYIPYEKEQVRLVFERFDEDKSGEISVLELRTLLDELGFIPLHAMVAEALKVVDTNGNGDLDFEEFVMFLAVYRRAEGFTQHEVAEIRRIFDFFSRHGDAPHQLLPADQLSDALVQVFGLHVCEFTEKLEEQLKSGQGLQSSSYAVGGGSKPEGLRFSEFLIFARKTREAALNRLKQDFPGMGGTGKDAFEKSDLDGNGGISVSELRQALKTMGYTPLKQNLEEILIEVDKDKNRELDFNEFFDFMLIFQQREGFRKQGVEEMRKVFERFDSNGSGEISALQLADLFRELGYTNTLDEIHIFVAQVDENNSGQLDFREYLRLMRLHREDQLDRISHVFEECHSEDSGLLLKSDVSKALEDLEPSAPQDLVAKSLTSAAGMDFDSFVGLVDACRADRVARERKKAGFTDERIAELQALFERFDKDKGGEIDTVELLGILQEFGWEPKSREEQQALVKKLDTARRKAREAGIEDVGPDGSGTIKFWTFVQLSRMLETEHQQAEEDRLHQVMQRCKFTQKEVEQFREIFLAKKQECAEDAEAEGKDGVESKGLPRDAVRRLIKALGVAIIGEKKPMLDKELARLGCTENGLLDFFGFLELMRWLMETGWLT